MPAAHLLLRLIRLLTLGALLLAPGLAAAAPPPPGSGPGLTDDAATSFAGPYLRSCGHNYNGTFTTSSTSFVTVVTCNLVLAKSGTVLVLANASVGLTNSAASYEANFRVDHNTGGVGDNRTDRYVDVFPDSAVQPSGDGTDRNVAITSLYTVTAGYHGFALLVKRTEGDDPVELIDASISVLFVPADTDLQLCAQQVNGLWTNNTSTLYSSVKCSLDVPRPGVVFVSADAWLGLDSPASGPYEAEHRIVMDGNTSNAAGIRYTNVYTNGGDGVDTTVAASLPFTVTAGLHEFKLMFSRDSDTGTVRMAGAGLVALYVPFDSAYAQTCSAAGLPFWQNNTTTYTVIDSCSLTVPQASWVFMSSTAGVGLIDQENAHEAVYGLSIDGLSPIASGTRYVNSYPDAGSGLDGSMANSLVMQMQAGTHTYAMLGRRFSGTGPAQARYPVLFVLVPGLQVYVPQLHR